MKSFKQYNTDNKELDEGAISNIAKSLLKVGTGAIKLPFKLAGKTIGAVGRTIGAASDSLSDNLYNNRRSYYSGRGPIINIDNSVRKQEKPNTIAPRAQEQEKPKEEPQQQKLLPVGGDDVAARNADANEKATSDMARRIASTVTKRLTRRFITQMQKAGRRSLPPRQPELFDDAKGGIPVSSGQKYPLGF